MIDQRRAARDLPPLAIVPAIDLLAGRLVRLVQGRYDRVLGYDRSPVQLARVYAGDGAEWLHVVDLDGAREGGWRNLPMIGEIASAVGVPVQAGGGARDELAVREALRLGVDRVVISTAAMGDRDRLARLIREFGSQLAVSLDVRGGQVVTEGWTVGTGSGLVETARRLVDAGVGRLIHTDVVRDGMLAGPGLAGLEELTSLGVPVMVAGGVSGYRDLEQLRAGGAEAAIVGRALLDGSITLRAARLIGGRPVPPLEHR